MTSPGGVREAGPWLPLGLGARGQVLSAAGMWLTRMRAYRTGSTDGRARWVLLEEEAGLRGEGDAELGVNVCSQTVGPGEAGSFGAMECGGLSSPSSPLSCQGIWGGGSYTGRSSIRALKEKHLGLCKPTTCSVCGPHSVRQGGWWRGLQRAHGSCTLC